MQFKMSTTMYLDIMVIFNNVDCFGFVSKWNWCNGRYEIIFKYFLEKLHDFKIK